MIVTKDYSAEKLTSSLLYILILIYVFTCISYYSFSGSVQHLITIVFVFYALRFKTEYFKSTTLYFIVISLLLACITWLLAKIQLPDLARSSPRIYTVLGKLAFIPIAFVLMENINRIKFFYLIFFLSIMISPILVHGGFSEFVFALKGKRTGLSGHIITMGIIYSMMLFACLVFFKRYVLSSKNIAIWLLWFLVVVFSVFGIFASQTRSVYIGLLLIYGLYAGWVTMAVIFNRDKYRQEFIYFVCVTLFLIIVYMLAVKLGYYELVVNKINKESSVVSLLLAGEIDKIPKNSLGFRIHFWQEAYAWILERPLFGWGDNANSALHAKAGNVFGNRYFITVHNDIFEVLLAYGVAGLLLHLSIIVWCYCVVLKAWKTKILPNDMFVFFNIFYLFFLFNGMFMSLFYFKESLLLWNVVIAGYIGYVFSNKFGKGKVNEL